MLFPGALGDLCLLAPSLASAMGRGVQVELCVQRSLVPLARLLLPSIEVGPPMDGALMASLFAPTVAAELACVLRRADRVHAWLRRTDDGGLAARFAALGVSAALHAVPRDDASEHVGRDYAAMIGLTDDPGPLRVAAPPTSIALPWTGGASGRLVLHPGAGSAAKVWSFDGFRCVADAWRSDGGEVAVLLGPAEEAHVARWNASGHHVLSGLAILDAVAAIASASTWLGNDAGTSHLAGVVDRRGVVLFGPTRAARWRPLGGRLTTVDFAGRTLDAVAREVREHLGAPSVRPYLDTPNHRH